MQRIENLLRRAERMLFPERVREREYWHSHSIADKNAQRYISELPPLNDEVPIVSLDAEEGTTIQVYKAENSRQFVLIIPGFNSDGQSHKYHWLISELTRKGAGVARINNQPNIDLQAEQFHNSDDYVTAHQELFLQYMRRHLERTALFLRTSQLVGFDKPLHIVASSAGASAALALHHLFEPIPNTLVLLGPSGDVAYEEVKLGISTYLQDDKRQIFVVAGEYDSFRRDEPYTTLRQRARSTANVSVTIIENAEHDLRDENVAVVFREDHEGNRAGYFVPVGGVIQLGIHRECLRAIGLPTHDLDEICGSYPYVRQLD